MRTTIDVDEMFESDPLAVRLASVEVAPMSATLWQSVRDTPHVGRREQGHPRKWFVAAALLIAALSLAEATPVGATIGRAVLPPGLQQRIGLVTGAPIHVSPIEHSTANGSAGPNVQGSPDKRPGAGGAGTITSPRGADAARPNLSLVEAQRAVDFPIQTPAVLPAGATFRGALVDSSHSVFLQYGDASSHRSIGLWIRQGEPTGGSLVPSSAIQAVQVNGSSAFYVHGSYEDSGPTTVGTWNPAADAEELTWRHNGMTYNLTSGGFQLSSKDLIQIAESLR